MTLNKPIRSATRARSSQKSGVGVRSFSKGMVVSLASHGLLLSFWVLFVSLEVKRAPGEESASPAIAMLQRAPVQFLPSSKRVIPPTEVPPIPVLPVEPIESPPLEVQEFELDQEELLDPLLMTQSFDEIELESLSAEEEAPTPESELIEEESVGEIAVPVRLLLESPEVSYPRAAYLRNLEGTVVLSLIVNSDGVVTEVRVIQSSGHRLLDRAAVAAARGYLFESGGGSVTVEKPFTFRLP
jgi:protein TonB